MKRNTSVFKIYIKFIVEIEIHSYVRMCSYCSDLMDMAMDGILCVISSFDVDWQERMRTYGFFTDSWRASLFMIWNNKSVNSGANKDCFWINTNFDRVDHFIPSFFLREKKSEYLLNIKSAQFHLQEIFTPFLTSAFAGQLHIIIEIHLEHP